MDAGHVRGFLAGIVLLSTAGLASAAAVGDYADAATAITALTAVGWGIVILGIVWFIVEGVIKLKGHQFTDGFLNLGVALVVCVLCFTVLPPMIDRGAALASTPDQKASPIEVRSEAETQCKKVMAFQEINPGDKTYPTQLQACVKSYIDRAGGDLR